MLDQISHFNDLSPELRTKLEEKVKSFGDQVTYVFNIARDDPHPDNRGKKVYPQIFTLTPGTFTIQDKLETRKDKSQSKTIGAVNGLPDEKGRPQGFLKLKVHYAQMGRCTLDLTTKEGQDLAMVAELHPKHEGGMFASKGVLPVFRRIDEKAEAKAKRSTREIRTEALLASSEMTEQEARDFAAGMGWDEMADIAIVRDQVESYAEEDAPGFIKIVNSGTLAYRAVVKRAFDKQILIFIPLENKVIWGANQQMLAILPSQETGSLKTHVEAMAEWLTGATDGDKTYKTLKTLVGSK